MAVGIAVGVIFWVREARERFEVPALVCAGCAPPEWFRWTQLLLAAVGIAAALAVLAYMVHFTVREIVWRRWRGVSITFGVLAATDGSATHLEVYGAGGEWLDAALIDTLAPSLTWAERDAVRGSAGIDGFA